MARRGREAVHEDGNVTEHNKRHIESKYTRTNMSKGEETIKMQPGSQGGNYGFPF